jgi:hypothetical protein
MKDLAEVDLIHNRIIQNSKQYVKITANSAYC